MHGPPSAHVGHADRPRELAACNSGPADVGGQREWASTRRTATHVKDAQGLATATAEKTRYIYMRGSS